jgi:hypothetical protein
LRRLKGSTEFEIRTKEVFEVINARELVSELEMMIKMYGEECEIATFSGKLDVYDENGDYRQEIDI